MAYDTPREKKFYHPMFGLANRRDPNVAEVADSSTETTSPSPSPKSSQPPAGSPSSKMPDPQSDAGKALTEKMRELFGAGTVTLPDYAVRKLDPSVVKPTPAESGVISAAMNNHFREMQRKAIDNMADKLFRTGTLGTDRVPPIDDLSRMHLQRESMIWEAHAATVRRSAAIRADTMRIDSAEPDPDAPFTFGKLGPDTTIGPFPSLADEAPSLDEQRRAEALRLAVETNKGVSTSAPYILQDAESFYKFLAGKKS